MSEDHSSATVPLELEFVEGLTAIWVSRKTKGTGSGAPLGNIIAKQLKIRVPLVTNDFSA